MVFGEYYKTKCEETNYSKELKKCIEEACEYCISNIRSENLGNPNYKGEHPLMLLGKILEQRGVVIKYADAKEPLSIARDKYDKNELKEAATKCRQATESITNRLWKKLLDKYSCKILVALRGPKSIPDLYSVVSGLIVATNKKKISGAEEINVDLITLRDTYNWMLLNKGTHFEDNQKEFERADIRRLIELLEKMDKDIADLKVNITLSA